MSYRLSFSLHFGLVLGSQKTNQVKSATVYPFIDGKSRGDDWQTHLSIPFTQASEDIQLPDKCFGIHWYGGCQVARQYNTISDVDTYKGIKCLITREIKRVMEQC